MGNTIAELKEALKSGIVEFTYTKVNGDERKAKGTLRSDILDEKSTSNGSSGTRKQPDGVICYYDLNSEGWRSFREENFVSVDNISE